MHIPTSQPFCPYKYPACCDPRAVGQHNCCDFNGDMCANILYSFSFPKCLSTHLHQAIKGSMFEASLFLMTTYLSSCIFHCFQQPLGTSLSSFCSVHLGKSNRPYMGPSQVDQISNFAMLFLDFSCCLLSWYMQPSVVGLQTIKIKSYPLFSFPLLQSQFSKLVLPVHAAKGSGLAMAFPGSRTQHGCPWASHTSPRYGSSQIALASLPLHGLVIVSMDVSELVTHLLGKVHSIYFHAVHSFHPFLHNFPP